MLLVAYISKNLGSLFVKELEYKLAIKGHNIITDKENDYCFFNYKDKADKLKSLVLPLHIFAVVDKFKLSGERSDLSGLEKINKDNFLQAMSLYNLIHPANHSKIVSYAIYVKAIDCHWRTYRRIDMGNSLLKAMTRNFTRWQENRAKAKLELWAQQLFKELFLLLRLTINDDNSFYSNMLKHMAYISKLNSNSFLLVEGFNEVNSIKIMANYFRYKNLILITKNETTIKSQLGDSYLPYELKNDIYQLDKNSIDIFLLNASDRNYDSSKINQYTELFNKGSNIIILSGSRDSVEKMAVLAKLKLLGRYGPVTLPYGKIAYIYHLERV